MVAEMIDLTSDNNATSEIVLVTPDMAKDWLAFARFNDQRTVKAAYVTEYANLMAAGDFQLSTINFVEVEGRLYLTNGQHRLLGLVQANTSLLFNVVIKHGQTMADVGEDYATHDIPVVRNGRDRLKALGLHADLGLSLRNARFLEAALPMLTTGFQYNPREAREKKYQERVLMAEFAPEARIYFELIKVGKASQRLYSVPAVAVALITLRYQVKHAEEFWGDVGMNDELGRNTPEHTLVTWLLSTTNTKTRNHHVTARYIASAWNAKFDGRTLSTLRVMSDHKKPIILRGTPFNGKAPYYVTAKSEAQA